MAGSIQRKKQGDKTYYYYHETYREKIDASSSGKTKGTGKSKIITINKYLGTASEIYENFKTPSSVKLRNFGVIAAAYQTALELDIIDILKKYIPGKKYGVEKWLYFFIPILNRLDSSTSKNKMSDWLKKTILPELFKLNPEKFSSKKFWYVTDDVISEKEVLKNQSDELFKGVNVEIFNKIEEELYKKITEKFNISENIFFYDTTNFYTYIQPNGRSRIALTGHNKDSKHHLKQVGLLMAVERNYGFPVLHRIYRGNSHDSKTFNQVISELILQLKKACKTGAEVVIVIDKGNNSEDNFKKLNGKISWIGSLSPSQNEDLINIKLSDYKGIYENTKYYRCKKTVMSRECAVVVTFNEKLKSKKIHSLENNIKKIETKVIEKWNSYKKKPKAKVPKGILTILSSKYGKCLNPSITKKGIKLTKNKNIIEERKKSFGKNIIFSDMLECKSDFLISTYRDKNKIEEDNKLLKDKDVIRFNPIRHWTDSKIRAYSFCCVIAMVLLKAMQVKAERDGYKVSNKVLIEELRDIKEVLMIYDLKNVKRMISERSSVQNAFWNIFEMGKINNSTTLHNLDC